MICDVEEETRDFKTNFRSEYGAKNIPKSFEAKLFEPEYYAESPLIEAYKDRLYTLVKNKSLPSYKRTELAADFFNRVRSENPHLIKVLPKDPPDEALVSREEKKLLRSVYQLEITKTLDDHDKDRDLPKIEFPKDHAIPETIQKISYRDPRHYSGGNKLKVHPLAKLPDNLVVDEKEREILRVRTGFTEYQDVIGKVGRRIMDEQFFGPPLPINPPERLPRDPDTISVCSEILKGATYRPY